MCNDSPLNDTCCNAYSLMIRFFIIKETCSFYLKEQVCILCTYYLSELALLIAETSW